MEVQVGDMVILTEEARQYMLDSPDEYKRIIGRVWDAGMELVVYGYSSQRGCFLVGMQPDESGSQFFPTDMVYRMRTTYEDRSES